MSNVKRMILEHEDETLREIKKGLCIELKDEDGNIAVDILDVKSEELCFVTIGLIQIIKELGLAGMFMEMLSSHEEPARKEFVKPDIEEMNNVTDREGNAYGGTDRELLEGNMQNEEVGEDKPVCEGEDRSSLEDI